MPAYLEPLPPTSIFRLEIGQHVKVIGRLVGIGTPLVAPVSGRSCVHWQVRVWLADADTDVATVVRRASVTQRFVVEDATGRIWVAGERASVWAELDETRDAWSAVVAHDEHAATLAKLGVDLEVPSSGQEHRVYEGILEDGQQVAVRGTVAAAEASPYRDASVQLELGPPLFVSEHDDAAVGRQR